VKCKLDEQKTLLGNNLFCQKVKRIIKTTPFDLI
jgi:hypothetical protein